MGAKRWSLERGESVPVIPKSLNLNRKNTAPKQEFPQQPRTQRAELNIHTSNDKDLGEIINLFSSGTINSYIQRYKGLVGNSKRNPETISNMMRSALMFWKPSKISDQENKIMCSML